MSMLSRTLCVLLSADGKSRSDALVTQLPLDAPLTSFYVIGPVNHRERDMIVGALNKCSPPERVSLVCQWDFGGRYRVSPPCGQTKDPTECG